MVLGIIFLSIINTATTTAVTYHKVGLRRWHKLLENMVQMELTWWSLILTPCHISICLLSTQTLSIKHKIPLHLRTQAQGTACKLMWLHASSWICALFWNILHAFWNIPHAFWNIPHAFWNILEYSACLWVILEHSACILEHYGKFCMTSVTFWNILEHSGCILEHSACIL